MSSTWRVRRSVASSQKSPHNFDDIGCQSANSTADEVFQEFKSELIPHSSFYVLKNYPYVCTCPDLWSNCNRVQKFTLILLDCLLVLRLWMVLVWPCNRFTRCLILIFEINHLICLINKRGNTLKYKFITSETAHVNNLETMLILGSAPNMNPNWGIIFPRWYQKQKQVTPMELTTFPDPISC